MKDIILGCNLCGRKGDEVKLRTIEGREYLVCKLCRSLGDKQYGEQTLGERYVSRIQAIDAYRSGYLQSPPDGLSDRIFSEA